MVQDSLLNVMDHEVGPVAPIVRGPQAVLVPGGSGDERAASSERRQFELALLRDVVAVEVLRIDGSVEAHFAHGWRGCGDQEAQAAGFVPGDDALFDRA